ncbi:hypothetical protein J437_LFUL011346 [Ladona fulva]|uniref:Uncharacterized protein n=1 Tax=Ladona fulva TaxID=123851 RepID=A0A8K0P2M7_LADFU|nr:hypothetical protein J437_LFUL011346 [Ladona fulva]
MPSEDIVEQGMEPYVCSLSEEVKRYAAEKLHEDEDKREEEIKKIREWLQEEDYLRARTDDLSILKSLRGCKFNIDVTKRKLKNLYEMRAKVPEWYENRDPSLPELQDMLKMG